MNRRGFLQGILAFGIAPFIVTTGGVLMPVRRISSLFLQAPQTGPNYSFEVIYELDKKIHSVVSEIDMVKVVNGDVLHLAHLPAGSKIISSPRVFLKRGAEVA